MFNDLYLFFNDLHENYLHNQKKEFHWKNGKHF